MHAYVGSQWNSEKTGYTIYVVTASGLTVVVNFMFRHEDYPPTSLSRENMTYLSALLLTCVENKCMGILSLDLNAYMLVCIYM